MLLAVADEIPDDEEVAGETQLLDRGQLVVDRSQGKTERFELYSTTDGGETWIMKAASEEPMRLPNPHPPEKANWRAMADKDAYQVERRTATGWETLARFPIRAGECK